MTEFEIRQIIQDELTKSQFNVARVPFHTHNGVDSPLLAASTISNSGGAVIAPTSNTDAFIPQWNGTNSKTLKDGLQFDTDGTLTANSDSKIASQKATKTYVDTKDALNILKSIGTAKGDLIGFSASGTPVNLAVGTNDYYLAAASGQTSGLLWKALPAGTTPQQINFSKTFSVGAGSAPYVLTVSPGFHPLFCAGLCAGGASAGTTTGWESIFFGSPSTAGFSMVTIGPTNLTSHGAYNTALIGYARDGSGDGIFDLANWTATSFDIQLTRSAGTNSGGTVAGIVYGY